MQNKTFNRLLTFSLFFLAHWFFGNLYEEIVLTPNQLTDSYRKIIHWQGFFTLTNPVYYYIPFTQLAVLVPILLFYKSDDALEKRMLKKASIFGILAIIITIIIVTQVNMKLFFGDVEKFKNELHLLTIIWLMGNAVRLYLVGTSFYFVFKTYIYRQITEYKNNYR